MNTNLNLAKHVHSVSLAQSRRSQFSSYWANALHIYDEVLYQGTLRRLASRNPYIIRVLEGEENLEIDKRFRSCVITLPKPTMTNYVELHARFDALLKKVIVFIMEDMYGVSAKKEELTCVMTNAFPKVLTNKDDFIAKNVYRKDLLRDASQGLTFDSNSCFIDSVLMILLFGIAPDLRIALAGKGNTDKPELKVELIEIFRSILQGEKTTCRKLRHILPSHMKSGDVGIPADVFGYLQDHITTLKQSRPAIKSNMVDIFSFCTTELRNLETYSRRNDLLVLTHDGNDIVQPTNPGSKKYMQQFQPNKPPSRIDVTDKYTMKHVLSETIALEDGMQWTLTGVVRHTGSAHFTAYIWAVEDGKKEVYFYDDLRGMKKSTESLEKILQQDRGKPVLVIYSKIKA